MLAALTELAAGNDLVGFECRQVTADGWVRWMEWHVTPRLEEGVAVGIGLDVTDRHVAMEQVGALRRIATLVAEATQPHDLFALVAAEVARVVDVPAVSIASYETDDSVVYLAMSEEGEGFGVGTRQPLDGTSVVSEIRRTHEPARIDDYSELHGTIVEAMRRAGGRSTVGSPIVVAGRLWGAMVVSTSAPEPLPPDTEARLADFTELLGAAIANAESRECARTAGGGADSAPACRDAGGAGREPDGDLLCGQPRGCSAVRHRRGIRGEVRSRWPGDRRDGRRELGSGDHGRETMGARRLDVDRGGISHGTFRTRRRRRLVNASPRRSAHSPSAWRTSCAVSSPITVDGRLWGAMSVAAREPLPPDTADRLEKFTALVRDGDRERRIA